MSKELLTLKDRFRGYFPVVIDIETAGFNANEDAILEIATCTIQMDENGEASVDKVMDFTVEPFEGATFNPSSLAFTGIDPHAPDRNAETENQVIRTICKEIRKQQKAADCHRSILVAHNAAFDAAFFNAALLRSRFKRSPFHPFVTFDTTTLAGFVYGQTVLSTACEAAGLEFDKSQAHSAKYDALKTTELFCLMLNKYKTLGGWPMPTLESLSGEE